MRKLDDEVKELLTQMQEAKRKDSNDYCPYATGHMETLISATNNVANEVRALNSEITTLNAHHKDIIRYLMIVVCVIALGKSMLEAAETFFGHRIHAEAETK